mgnify:CR=1 FL=1
MPVLLLTLFIAQGAKLELDEEPLQVRVPRVGEKDDALEVLQNPASNAALHEAVQTCALLGVEVARTMAAAKAGAANSVDQRLLALADGYLGHGDWVSAEKVLRAIRPGAGVHERLGHSLRAQGRFAEAAKEYAVAVDATSGPELEEIVGRVAPVVSAWVTDYEIGKAGLLRDAAKSVLTAMLPHQAGEGSETTKKLLARLEAKAGAGKGRPMPAATRVREALAVQLPALRSCYARALVQEPTLKGKLRVSFSADAGGKVSQVRTTDNSTGSKVLAGCLEPRIGALYAVIEPAAEVTVPFSLEPL